MIETKDLDCMIVPSACIADQNISISAKGLYTMLFYSKAPVKEEYLLTHTISSKEKLDHCFEELMNYGYLSIRESGDISVYSKPRKAMITPATDDDTPFVLPVSKKDEVKPKKPRKPSLFTMMIDRVREYTNDTELQSILIDYFKARMSPAKGSRFEGSGIGIGQINGLLQQLDSAKGDKIAVVRQSIDGQYFKFFDEQKKSDINRDKVASDSYTQEDIDRIKQKMKELDEAEVY